MIAKYSLNHVHNSPGSNETAYPGRPNLLGRIRALADLSHRLALRNPKKSYQRILDIFF